MNIHEFNYVLPKDCIATQPPQKRGDAKLLVLDRKSGMVDDQQYKDVVDHLELGDVLVINNTRVVKARLLAKRSDGSLQELVLLEQHGKDDDWYVHGVLYRGRLKAGDELTIAGSKIKIQSLQDGGIAIVRSQKNLLELAQQHGQVPLPPYMKRAATTEDAVRYQTEFAKSAGSVAAPTASLNMTAELIEQLKAKGVVVVELTLHVGFGTFLPIRESDIAKHHMHSEWFEIPAATVAAIQEAKLAKRRVVAVGTTVARTLEYSAPKILTTEPKNLAGEADIFIYPGYQFKIVDVLLTNFHAPKSTVLMLTAAFAGKDGLFKAYRHALETGYRFLSYGDSMLIL